MAEFNVEVNFDQVASEIVMVKGEKGDTGATGEWGLTGDINVQTDLMNILNAKENSADATAALALKANSADVYTKTETESAIADKELKSKAISIPVASVVANTDTMKDDYPYCYDYSLEAITADTWADVYPTSLSDASVVDTSLDGCNLTGAGTIRIYFLAVPTAVANVTIVYQKGVA